MERINQNGPFIKDRYLLYIDILGFGDLVKSSPGIIAELYSIIDDLNVHKHDVFETIVFSDTILVYNKKPTPREDEKDYVVMYMCEFAQDLLYRTIGKNIYFRAYLKKGEFNHYNLRNIDCYHGAALVDAYRKEKSIKSIGLFIDEECQKNNKIFRVEPHDEKTFFVFINQSLQNYYIEYGGVLPSKANKLFLETGDIWCFAKDIIYLKDIHWNKSWHTPSDIRIKFLSVWNYFSIRYPDLLRSLELLDFDLNKVIEGYDWEEVLNK